MNAVYSVGMLLTFLVTTIFRFPG